MSIGMHSQISSRTANGRPSALAIYAIAGLLVGTCGQVALGQQSNQPSGSMGSSDSDGTRSNQNGITGKQMTVKFGSKHAAEYTIEHPNRQESRAVRILSSVLPHMNIEKTVFARLVVQVDNEELLKTALNATTARLGSARPGSHSYTSFPNSDDIFIIKANSVEDAINLANELELIDGVQWTEVEYQEKVEGKAITTDPLAPFQWHVDNTVFPLALRNDHSIEPVYARGFTGAGVVVGILEADQNSFYHVDEFGTQFIHPDLLTKLNTSLSLPTSAFNTTYSHGVSVAGLVAAEADNGIAGSGVAYNAQLASLKNGSNINSGASFAHKLQDIDIINNSWGPVNESFPASNLGLYLLATPDDFEITIPQVTHSGFSRIDKVGLTQGIQMGRGRNGRLFVFSAGNGSHFQGFDRLALGNAVSLPGFGLAMTWPQQIPQYGYLDIYDPTFTNDDGDPYEDMGATPTFTIANDGIPDAFILNGMTSGIAPTGEPTALSWRWSGHLGDRVEYNSMAAFGRTLAIASVGPSNLRSGYSTTGVSILAGAYAQDTVTALEFTPDPGGGWGPLTFGPGLVTLSQTPDDPGFCDAVYSTGLFSADASATTCLFNGTSAAAPVAAGIFALMLEANPALTIRDIQHIIQQTSIVTGYDSTHSYWPSVILGLGDTDPDSPDTPIPTFWTTNAADIRHSDEFGFGIIDADAAVDAAIGWPGTDKLVLLDTGVIEAGDEGRFEEGDIPDATFELIAEISENLQTYQLVPGERISISLACVRDNISIENVELVLNIEGDGPGDLLVALRSPQGTISPLALPRGDSGGIEGIAYNDFSFNTYKHWGEFSGGTWNLILQDYRPDDETPEGELPTFPIPDEPEADDYGVEYVTYLGPFGLPGAVFPGGLKHSEKTLVSYRFKIYGTTTDAPVFEGCPLLQTSCPPDLDGNGIVDTADFFIFIGWYLELNPLADLDEDGDVDFWDLSTYRGIWIPGFCNLNSPFVGGRPGPGTNVGGDNDPTVRPI